ncbi:MAG: NADH-quinone oxidoreductase subunit N [Armatimonadota bacterium]|nr:NADH-quinone oxidoreductase subunit N [Armatimonadota bacterium]
MDFKLAYIAPELILTIGGMLVLIIGLAIRNRMTAERVDILSPETASITVLLAALASSIWLMAHVGQGKWQFGQIFAVDGFAIFFKIIALVSTILVILMSIDFFRKVRFHRGEYYALLVFATLAITTMAASADMIMIYLSLEFLSITSYILTGYLKHDLKSNEAALKFFLYGSIAAAAMIYGMSILYGLTGTTNLLEMHAKLISPVEPIPSTYLPLLFLAILLVMVGFGFKIAAVPFHQWAPDTYEGAPTPITAFLSVGSKAAGFAVLARVLSIGITAGSFHWTSFIAALSAASMTLGNLTAIPQLNIKRMLAYSSIAQAGYILVGVASMPFSERYGLQSVLLYVFIYLFMNLGAFAVVTIISAKLGSDEIDDYSGLISRSPFAAASLAFFLLALAGIPPTAGILAKFYIFLAAINSGIDYLFWLAVIAIVNTVISVYYYMNVARVMFFVKPKNNEPIRTSRPLAFVLAMTLAMTVVVLLYPQPFILMAHASTQMLGK